MTLTKNAGLISFFALVFLMLTGNLISVGGVRIFGIVVTLYRVFIPMCLAVILYIYLHKKKHFPLFGNTPLLFFTGAMLLWLIWGSVSVFVSPYSSTRDGLSDMLSLFLGLCSVLCFFLLSITIKNVEVLLLRFFKIFLTCLVIWAFFEILTGVYLPSSKRYMEIDSVTDSIVLLLQKQVYPPTTFFFNTNDFCVFLAIFSPVFAIEHTQKRGEKIYNFAMTTLIVIILSLSDANLAFIALILPIAFRVLLYNSARLINIVVLILYAVSNLFFINAINYVIVGIKNALGSMLLSISQVNLHPNLLDGDFLDLPSLFDVISEQSKNFGSSNSLTSRTNIMLDALEMTQNSFGLGVGAGGFSQYLDVHGQRGILVDPHNWWLEILSQYGVIVFFAFLFSLVYIFIKVLKIFLAEKNFFLLIYLSMCVAYVGASMIPSSYLSYSYQWILPAIGIFILYRHTAKAPIISKKIPTA